MRVHWAASKWSRAPEVWSIWDKNLALDRCWRAEACQKTAQSPPGWLQAGRPVANPDRESPARATTQHILFYFLSTKQQNKSLEMLRILRSNPGPALISSPRSRSSQCTMRHPAPETNKTTSRFRSIFTAMHQLSDLFLCHVTENLPAPYVSSFTKHPNNETSIPHVFCFNTYHLFH